MGKVVLIEKMFLALFEMLQNQTLSISGIHLIQHQFLILKRAQSQHYELFWTHRKLARNLRKPENDSPDLVATSLCYFYYTLTPTLDQE